VLLNVALAIFLHYALVGIGNSIQKKLEIPTPVYILQISTGRRLAIHILSLVLVLIGHNYYFEP